jgi:hypothetical protein
MTVRSGVIAITAALMLAGAHGAYAQGQSRGREDMRFAGMDRNGDGVITRAEWRGSDRAFRLHDWNDDGVLSGDEVRPGAQRPARTDRPSPNSEDRDTEAIEWTDWTERGFDRLDQDRDNRITLEEWRANVNGFRRADHNGDGVISRAEFLGNDTTTPQNGAYKAGYERGLQEGRAAGREDRERKQGWDLEGQRELETADSGYEPRMGTKPDYQAGYRAGFRRGYGEGWGPR